MYQDKTLVCKDCGKEFVFTAGEQAFYAEKGFTNEPQRCKPCRDARKNQVKGTKEYFTECHSDQEKTDQFSAANASQQNRLNNQKIKHHRTVVLFICYFYYFCWSNSFGYADAIRQPAIAVIISSGSI